MIEVAPYFIPVGLYNLVFYGLFVCLFSNLQLGVDVNSLNIKIIAPISQLYLAYKSLSNATSSVPDHVVYFLFLGCREGIEIQIEHLREVVVILSAINETKLRIILYG
jgi:hypothetical protein